MSTRRQASTTSLSKFARTHSPEFADRSLDFCNAFWGPGDAGVDVLFARMRGAIRTMEELKNFWKERALIEEQYAKRLASLAKLSLGKDEIGELRNSLDTLRLETEKQAAFHLNVAQQIKNELESPASALLNKQLQHKKNFQAAIEREFKMKQQQESHVTKAREKYEQDCMRINAYTAQATIMQGKELEKIQSKLERAQQTVTTNELDFQKFTRVLQDTTAKWEQDWKEFCDRCQDLEEERMEFMKDNMWAYANIVSIVCVSDDESCERVRLALEQFEPEKDMEGFVYSYGTGNAIPNPPAFVNYANPDSSAAAAQRPTTRPANFQRVTDRPRDFLPPQPPPAEEDAEPHVNTAGIGAGGGRPEVPPASQSRPPSRQSTRNAVPTQGPAAASATISNGRGAVNPNHAAGPNTEAIGANEMTMLKVGDRAYPVDLTQNPQDARPAPATNGIPPSVGQENDPLVNQMYTLRNSIRRPSPGQGEPQQVSSRPTHQAKDSTSSQLSPPPGGRGGGPPNKLDYRRSAEFVVGGPPPGAASSRPASPNPPTAVLAMPPPQQQDQLVRNVVSDYQQSFPGERKSISRPGSRAGSISGPNPMQQQQPPQQRPMSSSSMAGVGAQGRSPSPGFRPPSRAASPMQPQQRVAPPMANRNVSPAVQPTQLPPQNASQQLVGRHTSMRNPHGSYGGGTATPFTQANGVGPGHQSRQSSISTQSQRPVSPNPVGIALDREGRVVDDELANQYPRGYQPPPAATPQQHPGYAPVQPTRVPGYPPPVQTQQLQHPYGAPPPQARAPGYGPPPNQYVQQAPPPPQSVAPPQQSAYGQQYPQYGQPDYGRHNASTASLGGHPQQPYYNGTATQQYPPQSYGIVQRAPSPNPRAPSPQPNQQVSPTGAYTDDGRPILFYVTALYDYQATIDEEFDFQTNDVIAVTATPEDGWWSGELLDEARKQPGRHVFPSNFVRLL